MSWEKGTDEKLIDFLQETAGSAIAYFYPTAFAKYANISLEEAFEYLISSP